MQNKNQLNWYKQVPPATQVKNAVLGKADALGFWLDLLNFYSFTRVPVSPDQKIIVLVSCSSYSDTNCIEIWRKWMNDDFDQRKCQRNSKWMEVVVRTIISQPHIELTISNVISFFSLLLFRFSVSFAENIKIKNRKTNSKFYFILFYSNRITDGIWWWFLVVSRVECCCHFVSCSAVEQLTNVDVPSFLCTKQATKHWQLLQPAKEISKFKSIESMLSFADYSLMFAVKLPWI